MRGRTAGFRMSKRFYVYAFYQDGVCIYVGKGCGRRLKTQEKRFGFPGVVLKEFATEKAAYNYEARQIEKLRPSHNKVAGGGGAIKRKKEALAPWFKAEAAEIERVGSRVYAARGLLKLDIGKLVAASVVERIRQVANGERV